MADEQVDLCDLSPEDIPGTSVTEDDIGKLTVSHNEDLVVKLCSATLNTLKIYEFAITFGLHLRKQTPVSFTIDTVITRIQDVYDFDCQCVNQVKAFLGPEAQTQGP